MSNFLNIKQISRFTATGNIESLEFANGLNTIVGPPNSGKSIWLKMLDFALGDPGSPEAAFGSQDNLGENLVDKYSSIQLLIEIDSIQYKIERKWKVQGLRSKTLIDGEPYDSQEFSAFILEKLDIPIIRFSRNNPYSEKGLWVNLSFRMLLRHIYRQERFWNDLADQQPPIEQHAVLSQFLGLADNFFSPVYGELIELNKIRFKLQAQKDQFEAVLDQITRRMTNPGEQGIKFTSANALNNKINELEGVVNELLERRNLVIVEVTSTQIEKGTETEKGIIFYKETLVQSEDLLLSAKRNNLAKDLDNLQDQKKKYEERIFRFKSLQKSVDSELDKLVRTRDAGSIFSEIQITHCPACHQVVVDNNEITSHCFLCHQEIKQEDSPERFEFELSQLDAEKKELTELVTKLIKDLDVVEQQSKVIVEQITLIDRRLLPLRNSFSALVDSRLSVLDAERGRVEEKIQGYKRVLDTLKIRDELVNKITNIERDISLKELELDKIINVNTESEADELAEGMMEYINLLSESFQSRWPLGRIDLRISDRGFTFSVGRSRWTSIGKTFQEYFLFAYHYGLLRLALRGGYNYPGLVIIDFPAVLADVNNLSTAENYLVIPFTKLLNIYANTGQVIIAGRYLEGFEEENEVIFEEAWY